MTDRPLVSVITPTFNHAAFIGACIESVLAQSDPRWEQIVVDDGSTDGTGDVVARYDDPRVRYFRQDRVGIWRLAETYNRALAEARGEVIAILEGDDVWAPGKLGDLLPALDDASVVMAYGRAGVLIDGRETGELCPDEAFLRTFGAAALNNDPVGSATYAMLRADGHTFTFPPAVLIRRSSLEAIDGFQYVDGLGVVDYPTFLRLSLLGRFAYRDRLVAYWRRHPASSSWRNLERMMVGCADYAGSFVARHGDAIGLSAEQRRIVATSWDRRLKRVAVQHGRALLAHGSWPEARRSFARALSARDPLVLAAAAYGYCASWLHVDMEALMRAVGRRDLERRGLRQPAEGAASPREG